MFTKLARIAVFLLLIAGLLTPAHAERRVALVIGNAAYEHAPPLRNPANDAEAIAALLKRLGFDVLKGIDLSDKGFAQTIGDFSQMLDKGAEVAVFFYAGHGLQVNGRNYLAPVDAKLDREASLDFEAVRLGTILTLMERHKGTNLVFLDACRDNPLARNLARNMGTRSTAIGRGLARVETGVGTLIAYATQPGNVALDGQGTHSPFAAALLKHAESPGLEIEGLMRQVRRDVIDATSGAQVPWNHSSLTAPFKFIAAPAAAEAPVAAPGFDPKAMELSFWDSIREGSNAALFKEYLSRYPDGAFSIIARAKLDELKAPREQPKEEKVAGLPESSTAQPMPEEYSDPRELTRALQKELKRVGCDPGGIDGVWGAKARAALAEFNRHANLKLPAGEPSREAIDAVRGISVRICPLTSRDETATGKRSDKKSRFADSVEKCISFWTSCYRRNAWPESALKTTIAGCRKYGWTVKTCPTQ